MWIEKNKIEKNCLPSPTCCQPTRIFHQRSSICPSLQQSIDRSAFSRSRVIPVRRKPRALSSPTPASIILSFYVGTAWSPSTWSFPLFPHPLNPNKTFVNRKYFVGTEFGKKRKKKRKKEKIKERRAGTTWFRF